MLQLEFVMIALWIPALDWFLYTLWQHVQLLVMKFVLMVCFHDAASRMG